MGRVRSRKLDAVRRRGNSRRMGRVVFFKDETGFNEPFLLVSAPLGFQVVGYFFCLF